MPNALKVRSREPQEALLRAIYAEMLLDKAERLLGAITYNQFDLNEIEHPGESLSPSAWDLNCYQESFEDEVIKKDLLSRLSSEAKEVLDIFLTTPSEITEALLDISVSGERGNPRKYCKRKTIQYLYKPQRVKNYLRRFRKFSRHKIEQVFCEINLFIKETMV